MPSLRLTRLLVFLVPLLVALPFLNRAYFVDDHYFVEIATWLTEHPSLPYHFHADDAGPQNRGWEENGFVRMVNPLAHHYYLAAWIKIWAMLNPHPALSPEGRGTSCPEWFLRFGCVLLSCGSALILYELSRRWTYHPLLTTLLTIFTPAFWLSSYSLLIDPTMTFFALAGLFCLVRAVELDSVWHSWLGGAFFGLAILSKYPALFMLPLGAVWVALNAPDGKRAWRMVGAFILPLLFLLAYSIYTAHLYGQAHILAASQRMLHVGAWPKLFSLLVFFSGSLLLPLGGWALADNRTRAVSGLLAIALFALLAGSTGGFTVVQAILLSVWSGTALVFLGLIAQSSIQSVLPFLDGRTYPALWHHLREHRNDVFMVCWIGGFLLMMMAVMNWVAARYYCLVVPGVSILTVRLIERRWPTEATRRLSVAVAALFVFTAGLAYVDQRQANPSRVVGEALIKDGFTKAARRFYLGDSFTMSYLKDKGWTPAFPETVFKSGDLVLSKDVTMPLGWFFRLPLRGRVLATYEFPSNYPLKVMDYDGSAGFYASVWGALPFTWSTGPWERFRLFQILQVDSHVAS